MTTTWTTWAVQFFDRNGTRRAREFPTEAARTIFLDRGEASGAVSQVLATSDPTPPTGSCYLCQTPGPLTPIDTATAGRRDLCTECAACYTTDEDPS